MAACLICLSSLPGCGPERMLRDQVGAHESGEIAENGRKGIVSALCALFGARVLRVWRDRPPLGGCPRGQSGIGSDGEIG